MRQSLRWYIMAPINRSFFCICAGLFLAPLPSYAFKIRTLLTVAVLLGLISMAIFLGPETSIRLQIMNNSGQSTSDLTLVVRTGGKIVTHALHPLAIGETQSLQVGLRGEGSYEMRVILADGTRLRCGPGYIESEHSALELIQRDRIEGKYSAQP